ncbi:hypothetical protein CVS30_15020 [Arthrobacter psychrolactophilus]|uniref:DUF2786 domain-containing protein n=1 Tax=Arthrobacter psychrolactophilus TaxID=92442 RepID=A0A2V5JE27_9MICC|nr:DUF2786 domain-containing protein [Arthrobacter psychrolactophilus]PYI37577.1 hypothetical protein CVS30_15020 [Arthrobacter psychrolactophilus]
MDATAHKAKKTLKLITALLAKAENTPYPAEAQTFQEHAERLMVRYGIEQATIDAEAGRRGKPQEAMVEERFELFGSYRVGQAIGFSAIAHAFSTVRVLQSTTSTKKILFLIGAESDVQQVLRLFNSLQQQLTSAQHIWWLNYPYKDVLTAHEKTLERRQFQLGFLTTVAGRIMHLYSQESQAADPGTALVLTGRKERADDHVRLLYPTVRNARSQSIAYGSSHAHAAGSHAGAQASVNSEIQESS